VKVKLVPAAEHLNSMTRAAALLGVDRETLGDAVKRGQIKGVKIGDRYKISDAVIAELLAGSGEGPKAA
jgi:excisionase family DNA binding protein